MLTTSQGVDQGELKPNEKSDLLRSYVHPSSLNGDLGLNVYSTRCLKSDGLSRNSPIFKSRNSDPEESDDEDVEAVDDDVGRHHHEDLVPEVQFLHLKATLIYFILSHDVAI